MEGFRHTVVPVRTREVEGQRAEVAQWGEIVPCRQVEVVCLDRCVDHQRYAGVAPVGDVNLAIRRLATVDASGAVGAPRRRSACALAVILNLEVRRIRRDVRQSFPRVAKARADDRDWHRGRYWVGGTVRAG